MLQRKKKAAFEAAVKWIEAHSDTKRQDALLYIQSTAAFVLNRVISSSS